MPHDPQKVAECRAWLERAWADVDSAAILLGSRRPRPDTAVFHGEGVDRPLSFYAGPVDVPKFSELVGQ